MSTSHPDPAVREEMDPADVSDELAALLARMLHTSDWSSTDCREPTAALDKHWKNYSQGMRDAYQRTAREMLAAVLPEYERQVRERIVAELAAERQKVGDNEGATLQADYVIGGVCRGLSDAIEIVQGKR